MKNTLQKYNFYLHYANFAMYKLNDLYFIKGSVFPF
jgi:hypothetical protein